MSQGLPKVSFHDAEVTAMRLDRSGPTLELDIEVSFQTHARSAFAFTASATLTSTASTSRTCSSTLTSRNPTTALERELAVELRPQRPVPLRIVVDALNLLGVSSETLAQVSALGLPRNRPVDGAPMTSGRQWRLKQ